ncbi:MAG: hypothetical protein ACP5QO_13025 [Clostridia bacterium]
MEPLQVRLSTADREALRLEAAAKGTTLAEIARQAVREHLSRQTLARAVPLLDQALGKHVDRLAGLIAKAFVAADMANWQARALVAALVSDQRPDVVMREARVRSLADLRRSGIDIGEDEDMYHSD